MKNCDRLLRSNTGRLQIERFLISKAVFNCILIQASIMQISFSRELMANWSLNRQGKGSAMKFPRYYVYIVYIIQTNEE